MQMLSRARWLTMLAALPAAAAARRASAQASPKIRMPALAGDNFAEAFIARQTGAFARAGLDVELTPFISGGAVLQACAAGALDIGMGDAIQVTNTINAGIPFAFFAGAALYSSVAPATVLVVAKDGPVHTAKDFEGHVIGVYSLQSLPEISSREWLLRNGADPALVKFVEIPPSAMEASVERGTVAGATAAEPFLSQDKGHVRFLGKPYDMVAKSFALSAFYARRDWLTANAPAVRRLIGVLYDTARWANAHQSDTAPMVAELTKTDVDVVRTMTRTRYATMLEPEMLQPVIDIATKYKAVARPIPATDLILRLS
jgi:ABC-type nitrate/sulfonate/bicarbonate transport system substrate-binding protein